MGSTPRPCGESGRSTGFEGCRPIHEQLPHGDQDDEDLKTAEKHAENLSPEHRGRGARARDPNGQADGAQRRRVLEQGLLEPEAAGDEDPAAGRKDREIGNRKDRDLHQLAIGHGDVALPAPHGGVDDRSARKPQALELPDDGSGEKVRAVLLHSVPPPE
ncbi:MAG: hypothetical protein CVU63_12570 [Deltaproteobacteria bacterium HGW-Deltaproteobacteria-20]|nr:MAG: hypothetical protein CVU63_12570 [Deltaproteobacteria bacterium HGW-Deltaproteobacteria-20]